jgi:ketosteroid isomerase-like protein
MHASVATPDAEGRKLLASAAERFKLSARAPRGAHARRPRFEHDRAPHACGGDPQLSAHRAGAELGGKEESMSEIRARLKLICDAFNAHDLDRIMSFFADDCVLEMPRGNKPWGTRFEGKENVRRALAGRFEGLPDVHYGKDEHFVDGNANTGISKWTLTGTQADGHRIEVWGCDFYTFREGKVIRKDSYWKIVN